MSSPVPDPRLHAFDPAMHVAEEALRGQLPGDAWRFVQPQPAHVGAARLSLRAQPDLQSAQVTEALPGEPLQRLWDTAEGWARVRTAHDGYLGWARADGLVGPRPQGETLTVGALRAHAFAGPRISQPIRAELALGAVLTRGAGEVVTEQGRRWVPVLLPDSTDAWVQEVVFSPTSADVADLALQFLHTPYVWGGRSAWGLDCSGLTQVVYAACGRALPRDADQQQAVLTPVQTPARGDLAFFPGHVGLMLNARDMVHANATHMRVTVETLGENEYGTRLAQTLTGYGRWTR
ncbi:C40 family peptidase [Deinococcus taeanensis]|uniref:C40 family peptidase n=1 Tax=Deinococcus taeanensis TaxID=2737050 RepID=UPI001CDD4362|nr:SH3 domain-containing C40 family peptidase [Deinococcus taeanensis]UBV43792.1 C40 family peptidase [Deinococcus taeanensis]